MIRPARGFPKAEFENRTSRAQRLMAENDISALLLTTEAEVRYYTGFLTRFWESPTRPWFVVLPASGAPIAVIPFDRGTFDAANLDHRHPQVASAGLY